VFERAFALVAAALFAIGVLTASAVAQPAPPAAAPAPPPLPADEKQQATLSDDKSAVDAAKKWLEIVDKGNTGPLWDDAAKPLKTSVTRAKWISGLRDARKPYGRLESRRMTKFARTHDLPEAPSADYAIVEFDSTFAKGRKAAEQVIWMLESDGVWRVSGYYIR
jgi:hypothetical protein